MVGLLGDLQAVTQAKAFRWAKKELGIRSVRTGFGRGGDWAWRMPTATPIAEPPKKSEAKPPVIYDERASDLSSASMADVRAPVDVAAVVPADRRVGQIPGAWQVDVARLDPRRSPADIPALHWQRFVADCNAFIDAQAPWGRRAAELGWDAVALFGCSRSQPLGHLGMAGLLWAINGGRLARLHADWAEIERANGERRAYHRRRIDPARVTLPWHLR